MRPILYLSIAVQVLGIGCSRPSSHPGLPPPPIPPQVLTGVPTTGTAIVDHVFAVSDDGFSCISYQITWQGQQVIVDDPIHSTNFMAGDKITFLIMKHELVSQKNSSSLKLLHSQVFPSMIAPNEQ